MIVDPPLLTAGAVLGLVVGSFCATVAVRARARVGGGARSLCDHCGRGLTLLETSSLTAHVARRGACGGVITRLHPAGAALGALIVVLALAVAPLPQAVLLALLGLTLLVAALVDAAVLRLPDPLTAAIAALCGLLAWRGDRLMEGVVCAALAVGVLLSLRWVLSRRRGRQTLGLGDVKLAAGLAVWLGAAMPWALVLAAGVGLVVLLITRPVDGRLAFGPYLAAGAWSVGLWMEAGAWPI